MTIILSKLLTPCLTAVKNIELDTMILFTKRTELILVNENSSEVFYKFKSKTLRLLICLHLIFYSVFYVTSSSYK